MRPVLILQVWRQLARVPPSLVMTVDRPAYPHVRASLAATVAANAPALANIRTVLVRPSLPGNIGAAARALMTMGLTRLVLVAPAQFPHRDATSLASGAAEMLDAARVVETLDDALAGTRLSIGFSARPRHFAGRVASLRSAAREAVATAFRADVALVFGTEMSGLTNDELAGCTLAAGIPANPEYPSLNLAAAVQVVAWEIRAAAAESLDEKSACDARTAPGPSPASRSRVARKTSFEPASHDEIEALYAHAQRTLVTLGFLDLQRPRRLLPRLRRLFGRARLEREEVNILRGILASVDARCGAVRDTEPGKRR